MTRACTNVCTVQHRKAFSENIRTCFGLKCQARQALYFHPSLCCCSNTFSLVKKRIAGWINLLVSQRLNAWQLSTPVQSLCRSQSLTAVRAKQFTDTVLFDLIQGSAYRERMDTFLFLLNWGSFHSGLLVASQHFSGLGINSDRTLNNKMIFFPSCPNSVYSGVMPCLNVSPPITGCQCL